MLSSKIIQNTPNLYIFDENNFFLYFFKFFKNLDDVAIDMDDVGNFDDVSPEVISKTK